MTSDGGLILRLAYHVPIERFGDVIRIFWPYFAGLALFSIGLNFDLYREYEALEPYLGLSFIFGVPLATWAIGAACAVQWHRTLVLNEAARTPSIVLDRRDRAYWWRTFTLGIPYLLAFLILYLIEFNLTFDAMSSSPFERTPLRYQIVELLSYSLAAAVVVAFQARRSLFLPIIALDGPEVERRARKSWTGPTLVWRWTLLLSFFPLSIVPALLSIGLFALGYETNPTQKPGDGTAPWTWLAMIAEVGSQIVVGYATVVFLSTLSFRYAQNEREEILTQFGQSLER
jgi:hypothetical protein